MKTTLELYNNAWFNPGAGSFKRICWHYANILFLKSSWIPFSRIKVGVLRLFGAEIGIGVTIKPSVNVKYPWHLKIGSHVWIGEEVWIDNLCAVIVGDNVCLSQGAMILTGNHNYSKATFDLVIKGVTLEQGVWIGAKAVVCPGVTCRNHSVLAVASVATKDLEGFSIYQGNPATKVRERKINDLQE